MEVAFVLKLCLGRHHVLKVAFILRQKSTNIASNFKWNTEGKSQLRDWTKCQLVSISCTYQWESAKINISVWNVSCFCERVKSFKCVSCQLPLLLLLSLVFQSSLPSFESSVKNEGFFSLFHVTEKTWIFIIITITNFFAGLWRPRTTFKPETFVKREKVWKFFLPPFIHLPSRLIHVATAEKAAPEVVGLGVGGAREIRKWKVKNFLGKAMMVSLRARRWKGHPKHSKGL